MRRAARVDENQREIVGALQSVGASVQPLHAVGQGCPDLLVGWRSRCWTFEVKNPDKPPRDQKLTPAQVEWHAAWNGQVDIIHSAEEALAIMQEDTARDYNAQVEEWSGGGV